MSLSRRRFVVKRCSSSIPSVKDLRRHSGVERQSVTNSKEEKVNNNVHDQRSENKFCETPVTTEVIPHEEKLKNRRNMELASDSWQTYRSGLLIEAGGILTDHRSGEIFDHEVDDMSQRMQTKEQSKDDCHFTNPVMISENVDGRRSRQGFAKNNYSFSDEHAPRAEDKRYEIPAEKLNSFISFNYGSIPRPKRGTSRKKYGGDNQTRVNDIHYILHDDISRAVSQPRRSLSAASYDFKPRPKKNNFLTNSENGDGLSMAENIRLVLGDSIPAQQSRTSMSSVGGTIPRPKKKDSTRKPNFTDNIMLSRDIDQIIEEEVGDYGLIEKMYAKSRAVPRPKTDFYQKPKSAQDSKLEKDIEYILSDNLPNGQASCRPKKSSPRKMNYDDDVKGAKNMDTIIEEEVEEFDRRTMTRAFKSNAERHDSDLLLTTKMNCYSQKATPLKCTSEIRDRNNLPTNTHARDNIPDKVIDKRLEIPGFDSNVSSKSKIEKFLFNGVAEKKSKESNYVNVTANKQVDRKRAVQAGSPGTDYQSSEDHTIEELVAELFPELLADVLPPDVPYVKFPEASSVQPLNRDSACSVTDADYLRPMAAGLSKVVSVPSNSRDSRTCAEKWTRGVIYTDEELKLMAEIEKDYSVRRH